MTGDDDESGQSMEDDSHGGTPDENEPSSTTADGGSRPPMEAYRYADGSIGYPGHPVGPDGEEPVDTVDLSRYTATVVTWTTSTATPPGVREPNHLAIVEFDVDGHPVRAIGQLTTGDVATGDEVRPVYVEELRDPGAGIKDPESQAWDGYRFEPIED